MRVLAGMSLGFVIIMLICAGLTFTLVTLDGGITSLLRWIGAGYILWLAWHIARSDPASGGQAERPVSFWASLGLQFVNVKIILYGITALSTFCFAGDPRAILAGGDRSVAVGNWDSR